VEERMKVVVCTDYDEMSKQGAQVFADHIQAKPDIVLGLATGGTPEGMYAELVRMHKQEGLDFSRVRTFNLDEYVGLEPTHDQSYRCFMNTTLFDQTNIKKENRCTRCQNLSRLVKNKYAANKLCSPKCHQGAKTDNKA